jgi:O-antigen/teichoic acid export membrane protein
LIGRRSLIILVAQLISSGLAFIGLFFITRYFGAEAYGSISWTVSLLATFFALSDLGFGSAHIKRLNEKNDINDCISTYAAIKIALTVLTVAVTAISIFFWVYLLGGSITPLTANLIVIFILYQVLYCVSTIATTTYTGTLETFKSRVILLADPFVRVPLVILLAFFAPGTMTLAYTYVLGSLAVAVVALLFIRRDRFKWQRPTLYRSYLKFATPLILVTVISTVTIYLATVLIGLFGAKSDVAFYTSSQVLLGVVGIIGAAVATLTYPSFSKLHIDGSMHEIRSLTFQAERYLAMFSFPVIAVIVIFATPVASILLGTSFGPAGEALQFLAIGTLLGLISQVHATQILAVNRPDLSAKLTILSFAVFLPLLLILIPTSLFGVQLFGLSYVGAAIASLITAIVNFIALRFVVYRLTGTGFNPRLNIQIFALLVTAGVLILLGNFHPMSNFLWLVLYSGLAVAVFFGILVVFKEFTRKDLDYFLEILNVRKMITYIKEEVRNEERGKI